MVGIAYVEPCVGDDVQAALKRLFHNIYVAVVVKVNALIVGMKLYSEQSALLNIVESSVNVLAVGVDCACKKEVIFAVKLCRGAVDGFFLLWQSGNGFIPPLSDRKAIVFSAILSGKV